MPLGLSKLLGQVEGKLTGSNSYPTSQGPPPNQYQHGPNQHGQYGHWVGSPPALFVQGQQSNPPQQYQTQEQQQPYQQPDQQQQHHPSFDHSSPAPPPYQGGPPPQHHMAPQHSPNPYHSMSGSPQPPSPQPMGQTYSYVKMPQKRTYGLLAPNAPPNAPPILIVTYPSDFELEDTPRITITRGSNNQTLATITAHSLTTSKVDVVINGAGTYRFKKKFASQTGLSRGGGQLVWDKPRTGGASLSSMISGSMSTELVLSEEGTGPMIAKYVPVETGKMTKYVTGEGVWEMGILGGAQFEEVFVTGIAELERRRRDKEDQKVAKEVVGAM